MATLVWTGTAVCLVVFQATAICKDRYTQHIIGSEDLAKEDSGYLVQGQVLRLVQSNPDLWAWPPHYFLKVSKQKTGSANYKTNIRDFMLTARGPLCYRVSPNITSASHVLQAPGVSFGDQHTWTLDNQHLQDLTEHIWAEFSANIHPDELSGEVETLPRVWDSHEFPYKNLSGKRLSTF